MTPSPSRVNPRLSVSGYSSVNLRRLLQRGLQLFEREFLAAGDLQDRGLAAGAEFASVRNFRCNIVRDHDRTVAVGVNQIVGANGHPCDTDFAAEILRMHPGVRRSDR